MTDPVQPSTEQVLAALAASLLPLAGPTGVAAAAVVPAIEQLLEMFKAKPADSNYTVDDLVGIVASGNAHLAVLKAHVEALPQ